MLSKVITVKPETVSETPCFTSSRVTNKSLFDSLKAGDSLDEFFDKFPSVTRAVAAEL